MAGVDRVSGRPRPAVYPTNPPITMPAFANLTVSKVDRLYHDAPLLVIGEAPTSCRASPGQLTVRNPALPKRLPSIVSDGVILGLTTSVADGLRS